MDGESRNSLLTRLMYKITIMIILINEIFIFIFLGSSTTILQVKDYPALEITCLHILEDAIDIS